MVWFFYKNYEKEYDSCVDSRWDIRLTFAVSKFLAHEVCKRDALFRSFLRTALKLTKHFRLSFQLCVPSDNCQDNITSCTCVTLSLFQDIVGRTLRWSPSNDLLPSVTLRHLSNGVTTLLHQTAITAPRLCISAHKFRSRPALLTDSIPVHWQITTAFLRGIDKFLEPLLCS
jgi:hypothetical protein